MAPISKNKCGKCPSTISLVVRWSDWNSNVLVRFGNNNLKTADNEDKNCFAFCSQQIFVALFDLFAYQQSERKKFDI